MLIPLSEFHNFTPEEQAAIAEKAKPVTDSGHCVGLDISEEDFRAIGENHGIRGLGDLVALFAKPIAAVIGLRDCGGCSQRQEDWNKAIPFK